jgi:5,10-methylenetetrahydromethanopterin reductase
MANPIKDITRIAKIAEDMGYTTLWIPDERFNKDPFVILSAAALKTKKIKLATGVTNPYTRNPALIATAIASIDDVSEGRAILGLGAGNPMFTRPLGISQERPISVIRLAVGIIRKLLRGERVTVKSEGFTLSNVKLDFNPRGVVPIYIAGRGPNILRLGGEVGDGVIAGAGLASVEGMRYALTHIKKGAEKVRRDLESLDVVCWVFCSISEEEEDARDVIRPLVAKIINSVPLPALLQIGIKKEDAIKIKRLSENRRFNERTNLSEYIGREIIDRFSIAGSPDYCLERIEELVSSGVKHIGILPFANTYLNHGEIVEIFARKIMKKF